MIEGATLKQKHWESEGEYIPIWDKIWRSEKRIWMALNLLPKNKSILSIGCRECDVDNEIYHSVSKNITSIDFVPQIVEIAKKRHPHLNIIVMDALKMDFPDETFDCVFAGEVIEHIIDDDVFLREVRRVLKPNGSLIITTPNFCSMRKRIGTLIGRKLDLDKVHWCVHTKETLVGLLERNGFKIESFTGDGIRFSLVKLPNLKTTWCDVFVIKAKKV